MSVVRVEVPVEKCTISRFNSRKTRSKEHVEKLAERIKRNGFEYTRALWGVRNGDLIEIFAGGTRLEAVRLAGISTVPVCVYDVLADDEIARLEAQDNENDEYHCPVSILDVWAECHRLNKVEGWTQERIAQAKGWSRELVTDRCRFHADLCKAARKAVGDDLFDEGHCRAVLGVMGDVPHFSPWLTTDRAQTELVEEVLGKHTGKSVGIKPTVKNVREAAKRWKDMISAAEQAYESLDGDSRPAFVEELASKRVRSIAGVKQAHASVMSAQIARKEKHDAERRAEEARRRAAEDAEELRRLEEIEKESKRVELLRVQSEFMSRVVCGDARELMSSAPQGFKLLLTDPPYGMNFQSNRRVCTIKGRKIDADADIESAIALLSDVLSAALPLMADDSTALIWTGWRHEPQFRKCIEVCGFTIKGRLIWVRPNHGAGDLEGSFAPKHEGIIHAVKGNPKLTARVSDVFAGGDTLGTNHPTEKPLSVLTQLIQACTHEGDCVVDPFAGSGSTLIAAHRCKREFWGIELDDIYHRNITDMLATIVEEEVAA